MKTAVRIAEQLDSPYLVVHPVMPYGWNREADPAWAVKINEDYIRELTDYAGLHGVSIALENMPTMNHTLASVKSIVDFVKRMNHPNLVVCLDTGHANVTGEEIGAAVRECGSLLQVLHVHDNDGKTDSHRIPYCGGGNIDWASFRSAIHEIGFNGVMSLETGIYINTPEPVRESLLLSFAAIAKYLADDE